MRMPAFRYERVGTIWRSAPARNSQVDIPHGGITGTGKSLCICSGWIVVGDVCSTDIVLPLTEHLMI
jgi:hypothetical protein